MIIRFFALLTLLTLLVMIGIGVENRYPWLSLREGFAQSGWLSTNLAIPSDSVRAQPLVTVPTQWTATGTVATTAKLKVAVIGDSGDGAAFTKVIRLIQQEEVDLVLHLGDFSYAKGPTPDWLAAIDQLDPMIPYLGADGNHDDWRLYAPFFAEQAQKTGVVVSHGSLKNGSYAVTYGGLQIVFNKEKGDTAFNQKVLQNDKHIWKICSWHQNRHDFQAGGKKDEVTLATYQGCINNGALIATSHEHSYSRSYSLTDLSTAHYGAFGDPNTMQIAKGNPGSSFFFVSGLGGYSSRDYHAFAHNDDSWWATIYTSDRYCRATCTAADFSGQDQQRDIFDYTYTWGALFIEFNIDGDPYKARGYFKNVAGDSIDEFTIIAKSSSE
jgi:Calcineurin-like phosphoesterase